MYPAQSTRAGNREGGGLERGTEWRGEQEECVCGWVGGRVGGSVSAKKKAMCVARPEPCGAGVGRSHVHWGMEERSTEEQGATAEITSVC